MKTLELKLKKDVFIVDAINEKIAYGIIFQKLGAKTVSDYEFTCKGSELTEQIASELVDKSIHTGLYAYYVDNIPVNAYCYNSAKEAVISKVESKGFYWLENPYGNETIFSEINNIKIVNEPLEWQRIKAEEKTFRNPLIFVKK